MGYQELQMETPKQSTYWLFYFVCFLTNPLYAQEKELVLGELPVYKIAHTTEAITIDGRMDEAAWQKTEARSLEYFYAIEKPTDQQNTVFRMLWDDENLYAHFSCEDQYITARETKRDGQPYLDDCAELFLIPAPDSLKMHYGFEVNLYKASNDFIHLSEIYQGQRGAVYAFDPEYQVEVTVDGTINDHSDLDRGWTMEFAIPWKLFRGMDKFSPVAVGNQWAFLAIRQERNDLEGKRRSTSTIFPVGHMKNVHQPRRFGLMEFDK